MLYSFALTGLFGWVVCLISTGLTACAVKFRPFRALLMIVIYECPVRAWFYSVGRKAYEWCRYKKYSPVRTTLYIPFIVFDIIGFQEWYQLFSCITLFMVLFLNCNVFSWFFFTLQDRYFWPLDTDKKVWKGRTCFFAGSFCLFFYIRKPIIVNKNIFIYLKKRFSKIQEEKRRK